MSESISDREAEIAELLQELEECRQKHAVSGAPLTAEWDQPDHDLTPEAAEWPAREREILARLRELGAPGHSDPPLGQ